MIQLFVGLFTEGSTDIRFLESIVKRTIEEEAYHCSTDIEIILQPLKIDKKGLSFVEQVLQASKQGLDEFSMTMLCVQADADKRSLKPTYENKIIPAQNTLSSQPEKEYCKILVALVPIQEMEAWMLADTSLLKSEINTNLSDNTLKINKLPEKVANPKEVIEEAIRIAQSDKVKRKRHSIEISDLYALVGENISLEKLDALPSYQDFKDNIRKAFRELNLLY
jgi:hypothetical protein